jgi:hypothetical protein
MSGLDAIQGEMGYLGLTGEDERELKTFALAVQASLVAVPDQAIARNLIPELATAAAVGHRDNVVAAPARAPRRRRFRMVARIAGAMALLPALFAGLAVAGVAVPQVAQDAFEAVGVDLPNQDSDTATGTGTEGEPGENGKGAGQDKSNPARELGRGNGAQGRGRALGKRGVAPGHDKSKSNNAGGNGKGKAIGKTDAIPPGQARVKPTPPEQTRIPPPQAKGDATSNAGGGNSNAGGVKETASGGASVGQGPVKNVVSKTKALLD